jgi:transcriptional regulator with XRE-family HTH domain
MEQFVVHPRIAVEADEFKRSFGRRIRCLRKAEDITQERLAESVGCSTEYISRIERGLVSPSFETIARLAEALNVRPHALFDFDASHPPDC